MPQSPRPPLPVRHANPHIPVTLKSGSLPPVKYQILNCQGQDILVGRMKIETPTPTGHAFILRRFDTGAVSLTTMFRAAFPNAPEHEERTELAWVKENHDLTMNNGGPHNPTVTRLAGTWVGPALARKLGNAYALGDLIAAVVDATPDPHGNYRRSGKNAAAAAAPVSASKTAAAAPTPAVAAIQPQPRTLPTPSPTAVAPPAAKRRKESSPAPPPAPVSPPVSPAAAAPPRRSSRARSRTQSPGLSSRTSSLGSITINRAAATVTTKTPKVTKVSRREEVQTLTPGGSDLTVVDEETELIKDSVAGSGLQRQDEAEWKESYKEIVKNEAAKKEVVARKRVREDEGEVEEEEREEEVPVKLKRAREEEEETLKFDFKEPEFGERAIATNRRVGRFHLEPKTKQLAWGAAAFAIGMGAVVFLPNFL